MYNNYLELLNATQMANDCLERPKMVVGHSKQILSHEFGAVSFIRNFYKKKKFKVVIRVGDGVGKRTSAVDHGAVEVKRNKGYRELSKVLLEHTRHCVNVHGRRNHCHFGLYKNIVVSMSDTFSWAYLC